MNSERRMALIGAATAALTLPACSTTQNPGSGGKARHYVLLHGAWHGAWAWSKAAPLIRQAGHSVSAVTLSGLGERSHVAPGSSGLAVHVQDVDAFVPMQGQSMANFLPPPVKANFERLAAQNATVPVPPAASWSERWGLTNALVAWSQPRMTAQAARSFTEQVEGDPMAEPIRRMRVSHPSFAGRSIASPHTKEAIGAWNLNATTH